MRYREGRKVKEIAGFALPFPRNTVRLAAALLKAEQSNEVAMNTIVKEPERHEIEVLLPDAPARSAREQRLSE